MTVPPDLVAQIVATCHDLASSTFSLLGQGWDSIALLADGVEVVKLPRTPAATAVLDREARILALAAPKITLSVPRPTFHPGPPPLSRHRLIQGQHLTTADYALLSETARARLAQDLARFHAETHAIDQTALRRAGAAPIGPWEQPDAVADAALPLLSGHVLKTAAASLKAWAKLPPDPLGTVWGHFDAHGWNMAFNPVPQRLNGIYDFGDSGFGPLHQDLVYSAVISPDITHRLGRAYSALTGHAVDHNRLETLIGAHRLWELAKGSPDDRAWLLAAVNHWAAN